MRTLSINADTTMFTSIVPIPGLGFLPISAFLIKGSQPVLVDCGITPEHDEFMDALGAVIDPADIRWIWLTHADRDHTGALTTLLEQAPQAKVACQFITLGIMAAGNQAIPPERAHLVRDGSTLDIGDRTLKAIRPPLFDNPGTLGFFDASQRLLISSDCFGAPAPTPEDALSEDVASITEDELRAGQLLWGSVDSPWAHSVEESRLADSLAAFASHDPETVLSTHLAPIRSNLDRHIKNLSMLPTSEPFVAPDQAALEAMMAQIAH